MAFGDALKRAREEAGWTQSQLSRAVYDVTGGQVDLSPAEISRYEVGRVRNPRRFQVVHAVAQATGRPVEFFTDDAAREKQESGVDDEEGREPVKLFADLIESLDRRYGYARAS